MSPEWSPWIKGTASTRQRIQRLGRVLRPGAERGEATIYTLYATAPERDRLSGEAKRLEGIASATWNVEVALLDDERRDRRHQAGSRRHRYRSNRRVPPHNQAGLRSAADIRSLVYDWPAWRGEIGVERRLKPLFRTTWTCLHSNDPASRTRRKNTIVCCAGEIRFSKANSDAYQLYRIFEFRERPKLFALPGDVEGHVTLRATNYRAQF